MDFLERKKELSRTIFTKAELNIIKKQTIGINLSQTERNVLSRSIRKKLQCVKEYAIYQEETFLSAYEKKIIPKEYYLNLRKIKGIKNLIIHQYETIEDEVLYEAIKNELKKDIEQYVKIIKEFYTEE